MAEEGRRVDCAGGGVSVRDSSVEGAGDAATGTFGWGTYVGVGLGDCVGCGGGGIGFGCRVTGVMA